jgi:hypothetical protein
LSSLSIATNISVQFLAHHGVENVGQNPPVIEPDRKVVEPEPLGISLTAKGSRPHDHR